MASAGTTVEYDLDFSLTQNVSNPFVLEAYKLHFTAQYPLKCSGGAITLIAQEIAFDPGSIIDVSGADGGAVTKAENGAPANSPGQGPNGGAGANGSANIPGGAGGTIAIYAEVITGSVSLVANGGTGGPGQDGGDGAPGQTLVDQQAGGNGGNAGAGGSGGNGGNGGTITVVAADLSAATLNMSVAGGVGGPPGNHGSPGAGGQGGNPPVYYGGPHHGPDGEAPPPTIGPQPPNGFGGGINQSNAPTGSSGTSGSANSKTDGATAISNVRQTLDPSYWSILLQNASNSYQNTDYATAASVFHWLDQLGSNGQPAVDTSVNRARTLLSQILSNLDYYAHPRNYVPSLSVTTFESSNQTLINDGMQVDSAVSAFIAQQTNQQAMGAAIDQSIQTAQTQITKNSSDRQDLINQGPTLAQQINELLTQEMLAMNDVNTTLANLQASLSGGQGCSISEIVAAVSLIVTIASGIPVAAATISSAAASVGNELSEAPSMANINSIVKNVVLIKNTVGTQLGALNDIQSEYQKIKTSLGSAPDPSYDTTKLMVSQQDFADIKAQFEAQIAPLPASSQKSAYEAAVNHYLDLVQIRNQQLLAFNGLAFKVQSIDADNLSLTGSIGTLNNQKLAAQSALADLNTVVSELQNIQSILMQGAYYELLQQSRALDFWTLTSTDISVQYPNFTSLNAILASLLLRKTTALQKFPAPPNTFNTTTPFTFTLTAEDQQTLSESGEYSFVLDIDDPNFSNLAQVLVQTIVVSFIAADASQITPLKLIIEHSGYHKFCDMSGNFYEFVTQSRAVPVNSGGAIAITGQFSGADISLDPTNTAASAYVGVSPFTRWKVWSNDSTEYPSMAAAATLTVSVSGTARALVGHP